MPEQHPFAYTRILLAVCHNWDPLTRIVSLVAMRTSPVKDQHVVALSCIPPNATSAEGSIQKSRGL